MITRNKKERKRCIGNGEPIGMCTRCYHYEMCIKEGLNEYKEPENENEKRNF